MKLLFAGRHVMNTAFQEVYLVNLLSKSVRELTFLDRNIPEGLNLDDRIDEIIFAITSANQEGSRYNPIAGNYRLVGVERFASSLRHNHGLNFTHRTYTIPHFPPTDQFVDYVLEDIALRTEGDLVINPQNTLILCSTPEMIHMYQKKGFAILPAEFAQLNFQRHSTETPMQLFTEIVHADQNWEQNDVLASKVSSATKDLWRDHPEILRQARWLFTDPLITDSGGLTETRNYDPYAFGMGNGDIIEVKYNDIKPFIPFTAGKIVDDGCADGALLKRISKDFPDAHLIGNDASGQYIARANAELGINPFSYNGAYVHFHQRNIMGRARPSASIDVFVCNSTGHELHSYGEGETTIYEYLANRYAELKPRGRLVMRDVVGPENKERQVYIKLNNKDGSNENIFAEFERSKDLQRHLDGLSTYARFKRFARDYLAEARMTGKKGPESEIKYTEEEIEGGRYIVLRLKDAVEFMTKKDYTANWQSEMKEEFAFWDFNEWRFAMQKAGFKVIENPNKPEESSRAYRSDWIAENRWKNRVELFEMMQNGLSKMDYPVTNMVLAGEK